MRKSIAAMSLSATLLGGGAVGAVVFAPHLVGAAQTDTSTTDTTATTGATGTTPSTDAKPSRTDRLNEVLQPLVDDGTITAAQRDAVVAALDAAAPVGDGHRGPGGPGGPGLGFGGRVALDAVAKAIGIDEATLRTELQGSTIAAVAANHGVDVQTVIDALVADADTRIDQAVTDGKLTQSEADTIKSQLTDKITTAVNRELPDRPFGGPGFRGPRPPRSWPPRRRRLGHHDHDRRLRPAEGLPARLPGPDRPAWARPGAALRSAG